MGVASGCGNVGVASGCGNVPKAVLKKLAPMRLRLNLSTLPSDQN